MKDSIRYWIQLIFWGIFSLLATGLVIILVWYLFTLPFGGYEYLSVSGETGDAQFCNVQWGKPHCYTEDGRFMTVEWFKKKY